MSSERARRLNKTSARPAEHSRNDPSAPSPRRESWADILKGLLVVRIARAAQRVLDRRAGQPEAGRLGGHAGLPAAPSAASRPAAAAPRKDVAAREKAKDEEEIPTKPWPIAKFVFKEFGKDNGTLMAAAVAFYLLLSIIPLLLVAVWALGMFFHHQTPYQHEMAVKQVLGFLNQFVPVQEKTLHTLIQGIMNARGTVGGVGIAGVALTATGGFATLENAINVMWNRPNRGFIMNKLFAFGMMLGIGLLFALSLGFTAVTAWAGKVSGLSWLGSNGFLRLLLGHVLPVAISAVMFALIYKFYPNGRSGWKPSFIAGAVTAVFWEVFKQGYALYTTHGDKSVYGIVVGLVMWIFYSASLVLLGSELTWVLEGCPDRDGKNQVQAQRAR
jgi:membrane protein